MRLQALEMKRENICRLLGVCTIFIFIVGERGARAIDALSFLQKYGYLKTPNGLGPAEQIDLRGALETFQRFYGIPTTGVVDEVTEAMLNTPRCGVADIEPKTRRHRRYDLLGSRWRLRRLTYEIKSYPPGNRLSRQAVDRILTKAFKIWSDVTTLEFVRGSDPDIEIVFASGPHGDNEPFDGRGGVLAHALQPFFGGDVHLDNDESWSEKSYRGINLFQVVTHEIGHALGLGHSKVRASLMAPSYKGYLPNFILHTDDLEGIHRLYGRNEVLPPRPSNPNPDPSPSRPRPRPRPRPLDPRTTSTTTRRPHIPTVNPVVPSAGRAYCNRNFNINAMVSIHGRRTTYAFSGDQYYRLNNVGVDDGFPKPIRQNWPGITGPVNAAFSVSEKSTYACGGGRQCVNSQPVIYVFQGFYVQKFYSNRSAVWHSPLPVSQAFPGLPADIDAAFFSNSLDRVYFFKGSSYYRSSDFTSGTPIRVDSGYPRSADIWNVRSPVDSVFTWGGNNRTYFFYGSSYYRYNYNELQTAYGYPRDTRRWWFNCRQNRYVQQLAGFSLGQPQFFNTEEGADHDQQVAAQDTFQADTWESRGDVRYGHSGVSRPAAMLLMTVAIAMATSVRLM